MWLCPLLLLMLMFFNIGCHRDTSDILQRTDAMIDEHPDSALAVLEGIYPSELMSRRDRAIHSLLMAQAQNHLNSCQNDSLIDIALEYFSSHERMSDYALRSHYYKAMILQDVIGNTRDALQEYLLTLQMSRKAGDRFRTGVSCLRIAEIFMDNDMPNEAIRFSKEAYGNLKETRKKTYIAYSGFLLGKAYSSRQMPDSALHVLSRVEDDVRRYCHEDIYDNLKVEMLISTFLKGDYNEVIEICKSDSSMMSKPYHVLYCGLSLAKTGDLEGAENMLREMPSVSGVEKIQMDVLRDAITQCRHSNEGYHTSTDNVLNYNLKKYADRDRLGLPDVYMAFMDQKMKADEESIKKRTYMIWLIVACSVLLCTILAIVWIWRRNKLKRQLDNQIEFIESLKQASKSDKTLLEETTRRLEELEAKLQEHDDTYKMTYDFANEVNIIKENVISVENRESTKSDIAEFILSKYNLLNDISSLDVDYNNLIKQYGKSKYLCELKELIKNLSTDSSTFREIADIIDVKHDDIFTSFEQDFPDVSFNMKQLFLYLCMDLNSKFIMQLIGYSDIHKVYYLKKKLKALIKNRDVANRDFYLEILSR